MTFHLRPLPINRQRPRRQAPRPSRALGRATHSASLTLTLTATPAGRTLPCRGTGALGFPWLPESLPEQAIGSSLNTLAGRARGGCPLPRTLLDLTRPSWGAPRTPECFQVVREDGPHRAHLDPI